MVETSNDVANGHLNGTSGDQNYEGKTVYLVTGASRGLGKGLVAAFLQKVNSVVVACVRDVKSSSESLSQLPKAEGSLLLITKLDCASETDAATAVRELETKHNLSRLDVVVANAAIAGSPGPTSTLQLSHLQEHMMVNTYSVLLLFQSTRPLLEKAAPGCAKFVFVGAPISTITNMEHFARAPYGAYAVSKLAASYLTRRFHFENAWLISFVVDPGHIQTDMGSNAARLMGRKQAPTTIDESVHGICARVDEATKEKTSGQFVRHDDGSTVAW